MIDDQEPSQERTRFAILPAVAVYDSKLSHAAFRVLSVLASYSDRDGWAWPRLTEIGESLGMSKTTVSEHIGGLERLGYIEVERRFYEHGGQRSSRYRLVYDRWSQRRTRGSDPPNDGFGPAEPDVRTGLQRDSEEPNPATRRRPETTGTGTPEQEHENRNGAFAPARPVGNPRVQAFVDEVRRQGVTWTPNGRDTKAIREADADPALIAQAYCGLVRRTWGTDWQKGNAAAYVAIEHLGVFVAHQQRSHEYNQFSQVVDLTDQPPVTPGDLEGITF